MNDNQKKFCQEYIKNGTNGTKAYMKAYPDSSYESAMGSASELLRNPKIQEYIKELQQKQENDSIMSSIKRKEYLTKIILGKEKDVAIGKDGEYKKEISTSDKLKALDILNKMSGDYVQKVEVKQIETEWFVDEETK